MAPIESTVAALKEEQLLPTSGVEEVEGHFHGSPQTRDSEMRKA